MIYAMLLTQFINHASQLALMLHIIFYDFCSSLFYIFKKEFLHFIKLLKIETNFLPEHMKCGGVGYNITLFFTLFLRNLSSSPTLHFTIL